MTAHLDHNQNKRREALPRRRHARQRIQNIRVDALFGSLRSPLPPLTAQQERQVAEEAIAEGGDTL